MYGGYSAVAICEMVFAIIFFIVFMMELDKQFLVVNWLWSVSMNSHTHLHHRPANVWAPLTFSLFVLSGSYSCSNRCSTVSHYLSDLCDRRIWGRGSHCWRGETSNIQHQKMLYLFVHDQIRFISLHYWHLFIIILIFSPRYSGCWLGSCLLMIPTQFSWTSRAADSIHLLPQVHNHSFIKTCYTGLKRYLDA